MAYGLIYQISELREEMMESSRNTLTGTAIRKRTILNVSSDILLEVSLSEGQLLSTKSKHKKKVEPEPPKKATSLSSKTSQRGLSCKNYQLWLYLTECTF